MKLGRLPLKVLLMVSRSRSIRQAILPRLESDSRSSLLGEARNVEPCFLISWAALQRRV